jgi:hypothetical protein
MNGKFFIGIGVSRPRGMDLLPGVQNSIDSMVSWAIQQGYSSETITDGDGPVTADRIRQIIAPILGNQIDRIIVYFVGHGFQNHPDQIWILSDGPGVNSGRVSRDTLRASISTYRPKQISMISDACLEPRYFGSGAISVIIDNAGQHKRVFVDNFYSTLPNEPSYFFRGTTEIQEFCLFTTVLLEFLNGKDLRAFQLAAGNSPHVTTQTLYYNLPDAVSERAAFLNIDQVPRIEAGFPQGEDIYSTFPSDQGPRSSGLSNSIGKRRDLASLESRMAETSIALAPLLDGSIIYSLIKRAKDIDARLVAILCLTGRNLLGDNIFC